RRGGLAVLDWDVPARSGTGSRGHPTDFYGFRHLRGPITRPVPRWFPRHRAADRARRCWIAGVSWGRGGRSGDPRWGRSVIHRGRVLSPADGGAGPACARGEGAILYP